MFVYALFAIEKDAHLLEREKYRCVILSYSISA